MSLNLPVEAGSEAGSRHSASPVSAPLQRPRALAPPGVPPLSGEGSAQPSLAHPRQLHQTHPNPHLSPYCSSRIGQEENCWGAGGFLLIHSPLQGVRPWPRRHYHALGWSKGEASQTLTERPTEGDPEVGGGSQHRTGRRTPVKRSCGCSQGLVEGVRAWGSGTGEGLCDASLTAPEPPRLAGPPPSKNGGTGGQTDPSRSSPGGRLQFASPLA